MSKDLIEQYDTFKTKWCTDELIFGDFNDQQIPSDYYNFLNNDYDDGNNITVTPIENDLPYNEGAEDEFVPNDEYINA